MFHGKQLLVFRSKYLMNVYRETISVVNLSHNTTLFNVKHSNLGHAKHIYINNSAIHRIAELIT